uniref:Protein kinase domain-containing protein n=1 Tax=Fusarium oxysporum (strain Fo5176) TaxID=660025 RepID=A0A0D2YCM9_FUSOF
MATRDRKRKTRFIDTQDEELRRSPRPNIVGYNQNGPCDGIKIGHSVGSYNSVLAKADPGIPPPHGLRHNSEKGLQIAGSSSKEHYKTFFTMIIGRRKVDAAYRRSNTYGPVSNNGPKNAWLKKVSGEDSEKQLQIAQSIGHENFVRQLAVYEERGDFVVAYEFVPISLSEVVANKNLSGSELSLGFSTWSNMAYAMPSSPAPIFLLAMREMSRSVEKAHSYSTRGESLTPSRGPSVLSIAIFGSYGGCPLSLDSRADVRA